MKAKKSKQANNTLRDLNPNEKVVNIKLGFYLIFLKGRPSSFAVSNNNFVLN